MDDADAATIAMQPGHAVAWPPMRLAYIALVASIICSVLGQIVLKTAAAHSDTIIEQFMSYLTIVGFFVYMSAACFYMIAIRRIPLAVAYPSASLAYILIAVFAHFAWNEPLDGIRISGIALIGLGILTLHWPIPAKSH